MSDAHQGYMSQYKDPDFLEQESARIASKPSIRHQFNAGAYRLCVPSAERDPEIIRGLDMLAGRAEHTLNRMHVIARQDPSLQGMLIKGDGNFESLLGKLNDPMQGLEAVPEMYKSDISQSRPRKVTNLNALMGLPLIPRKR